MNIVIGNQKGGVGKSTLCILLANYLTIVQESECLILDLDFQRSISSLWNRDRSNFDNPALYEVLDIELEAFANFKDKLQQVDGHVIIDLPGKMDDNELIPIYQCADLVICPFAYDKVSFESTLVFAQIVKHLNKTVPLAFIPNRLKSGVRYEIKSQVNEVLRKFGKVFPELPDRVAFQRIDTLSIPEDIEDLVHKTFDAIHNLHLTVIKPHHGEN
jgi:chromosome partitioning protein